MPESSEKASSTIGEYTILERVSDSGQAVVYKARSRLTRQIVAVKVFKCQAGDRAAAEAVEQEAAILARLSHPNIVKLLDSFSTEDEWDGWRRCLVTEFLEGETLRERLVRHQNGLPLAEARDILNQCLNALIYAHDEHGVTHRDLKPSNIFLEKNGTVKLLDFGIARVETEQSDSDATRSADWLGSFDYMAPEFALEGRAPSAGDEVSDIFSLATCFYQMVSGHLPYPQTRDRPEFGYSNRWKGDVPPPSHEHTAFRVTAGLAAFVDKGLAVDRSKRFQTFKEMQAALAALKPRVIRQDGKDAYELLDVVGQGGFGRVYKARRIADGRLVAIKRLFLDTAAERFLRERDILQDCRHPHIVEYLDFFESEDSKGEKYLFLVMEFLEGMPAASLSERIASAPEGLPPDEVFALFRHYLEALEFLHGRKRQIIHRDIKPSNLYAPPGRPERAKIIDFGVAKDVTGTQTTGLVPGTWDYMAPEFVCEDFRGSTKSDLYAVGLSLYEALTGRQAFPPMAKSKKHAVKLFLARAFTRIDFDHKVFFDYPGVVDLINKATAKEPAHRHEDAAQMRMELERVTRRARRRAARALRGLAYAVLLPAAVGAGYLAWPGLRPRLQALFPASSRARPDGQEQARQAQTASADSAPTPAAGAFEPASGVSGDAVDSAAAPAEAARTEPALPPQPETLKASGAAPEPPPAASEPASTAPAQAAESGAVQPPAVESQPVLPSAAAQAAQKPASSEEDSRNKRMDEVEGLIRYETINSPLTMNYEMFAGMLAKSASAIGDTLALPDNAPLASEPRIAAALGEFWEAKARQALDAYLRRKEAEYLAAARGAFLAALDAAGAPDSAEASWPEGVLYRRWQKDMGAKGLDLQGLLPLPARADWELDWSFHNPFLAALPAQPAGRRISARMLPPSIVLTLSSRGTGRAERRSNLRMALVPDGAGDFARAPGQASAPALMQYPFYIALTETQVGAVRCYQESRGVAPDKSENAALFEWSVEDDDYPFCRVDHRNPEQVLVFCNWLSLRMGLPPVYRKAEDGRWLMDLSRPGFRLPTGPEWEYAARCGFDWHPLPGTKTWAQMESAVPTNLVWYYYKDAPRKSGLASESRYPVGVFDMAGNVEELCVQPPPAESKGPVPVRLVLRGGGADTRSPKGVMPWYEEELDETDRFVGFRVMLPVPVERF